jgi:hypothetical protein
VGLVLVAGAGVAPGCGLIVVGAGVSTTGAVRGVWVVTVPGGGTVAPGGLVAGVAGWADAVTIGVGVAGGLGDVVEAAGGGVARVRGRTVGTRGTGGFPLLDDFCVAGDAELGP